MRYRLLKRVMHKFSKIKVIALALGVGIALYFILPHFFNHFAYQDFPTDYGFPVPEYVLQGYVLEENEAAIRKHGWDLWAGLTSPSDSIHNGERLPIFSTWYSIPEVYNFAGKPQERRSPFSSPQKLTQVQLAHGKRRNQDAGLMSFVKFNRQAAEFIWNNGYNLRSTLKTLKSQFDAQETPVSERSIKPFPPEAISLKMVFWLVKNPESSQSEKGLTGLPIWDPNYPPPPNGEPPMHTTWTKGVAIDPAGKYPEGSLQRVNINGTVNQPHYQMVPVVPLKHFYAFRLSDQNDVAAAEEFMKMNSSMQNEQERFVTNIGQTPELGDYVVLLAMHVTTKEMSCWTFQTFWWSEHPNDEPFASGRPDSIKPPFNNYVMCSAYSTVSPKTATGGPPICFNPYLETDLGPTKPYTFMGVKYPPDPIAGTRSNCMSCHQMAGFPAGEPDNPHAASFGRVANQGYLSPADPYFDQLVKTDFLWSIPLKAVGD